jgi:hypothetical protein
MKKSLLILFMLAWGAAFSYAQAIKKAQPDSLIKIIPIELGEYDLTNDYNDYNDVGMLYTIGGKLVTKVDVVYRLLNYAPSAVEYNAYKKDIICGYVLYGSAFAAAAGSTFEFVSRSKIATGTLTSINGQPAFAYSPQNKTGAYILAGVAVATLVAGIITLTHGRRHRDKSVWLYNLRFE